MELALETAQPRAVPVGRGSVSRRIFRSFGNGQIDSKDWPVGKGLFTCCNGVAQRCLVVDLGCVLRFGTAGWEIADLQGGEFAHGASGDAEGENNGYEGNSGGYESLHVYGRIGIYLFISINKGFEDGRKIWIIAGYLTGKLPELRRMK